MKGFTLIELLVVIAIAVVITIVAIPGWKTGEQGLTLDRVVHKAGQDVRRTRELALRAEPYTCQTGKIFAYGIFFDSASPTSYLIFAECDKDSIGYDPGDDGIVETITFENDIQITSVSPGTEISAVFVPPTPQIFLKPGDISSTQVSFQRTSGAGAIKTLDITNKGVVDVD